MTTQAQNPALSPIPAGEPLPHRKTIREWLIPLSNKTTVQALVLISVDYLLCLGLLAGTVLLKPLWAKLLSGAMAGFVIGRLFVIGHDACHQSLTPHRTLNKWLGRIAFLPSITPYSLWEVGHNKIHHGYTNLKGVDFVWAPLSLQEYEELSPTGRVLQRLYRSGWLPGLYYLIEMWWKRMFFPNRQYMPTRRPIFFRDCWLVSAFGLAWIGVMVAAAVATGQSIGLTLLTGVVVPFLFWNTMIGFVVYAHHTHEKVLWHADKVSWANTAPFVSTTVHLTFPAGIGAMMHHIMEHTAHHVDMTIPLYRLKHAQSKLEDMLPGRIVVQPFSWKWYFQTARSCKLYDFGQQRWTDFQGRPTTVAAQAA